MEQASEQDPYDRRAIAGQGLTLLFAGKTREAADLLERGIGDRDMPSARGNLCQAYARLAYLSAGAFSEEYFRKAVSQAEKLAAIERLSRPLPSELSTSMFSLIYSLQKEVIQAQLNPTYGNLKKPSPRNGFRLSSSPWLMRPSRTSMPLKRWWNAPWRNGTVL